MKLSAAILLGGALAACAPVAPKPEKPAPPAPPAPPAEARFEETPWGDLQGWSQAGLLPSLRSFVTGCARVQSKRPWQAVCAEARRVGAEDEAAARAFFESRFSAYRIVAPDGATEGLVTGYYEPILKARRARASGFRYPIYGVPDDLVVVDLADLHPELRNLRLRGRLQGQRLVPYYSRGEIESTPALPAKPLAWVADAVELFFLQIQGSGLVEFSQGDRIRLGFAEQNGHPYRSLGRYLVDRGELKLEQASMQSIKAWGASNPDKLQEALNANPSYVFFRELPRQAADPALGPPGAMGAALTPQRSIAVDPRFIPLGVPIFLATTAPGKSDPLQRLVFAQDTGGAIRGAVRADYFWGFGAEAGNQAGRMRQQGRMWVLWPKGSQPPQP